jgi:hypothetical protein
MSAARTSQQQILVVSLTRDGVEVLVDGAALSPEGWGELLASIPNHVALALNSAQPEPNLDFVLRVEQEIHAAVQASSTDAGMPTSVLSNQVLNSAPPPRAPPRAPRKTNPSVIRLEEYRRSRTSGE